MGQEVDDETRVRLIVKALEDCGQEVTPDAVACQFRYETGREEVISVPKKKKKRKVGC